MIGRPLMNTRLPKEALSKFIFQISLFVSQYWPTLISYFIFSIQRVSLKREFPRIGIQRRKNRIGKLHLSTFYSIPSTSNFAMRLRPLHCVKFPKKSFVSLSIDIPTRIWFKRLKPQSNFWWDILLY